MTGTKNRLTVRLNGGKPWGFRLQGGAGTGLPLTVSKVRRKSKAYRNLYEGDQILKVNGRICENLTYDQVMEFVDSGATELNIEIMREGSNKENVAPVQHPTAAPEPEKAVTISSFEEPSSENILRKEIVTTTESVTKVTEKSEGFRIKSISCQPESLLSATPNEDKQSTNQPVTTTCSSTQQESVELPSTLKFRDILVPDLTKICSPFDTSTKSVSQEVTSDDRKFEKMIKESTHEKHGNTETTFIKTEHESVIKDGEGCLGPTGPSLDNSHFNSLLNEFGKSKVEESKTSSYKSVEKTTKESLSSFLSDTQKEVSDILTSLELTSTLDTVKDSVSIISDDENKKTTEDIGTVKKVPPPTAPKPKLRPFSDPCIDRLLDHADDLKRDLSQNAVDRHPTFVETMDTEFTFAPFELPFGSITVNKKKKMFSSSSFYEEPHAIYPTVEEQVEMAKKIADSLADDTNKKSKGANMFYKRVKKSPKWVHEGPEPSDESGPGTPEVCGETDPWKSGQSSLRLVLDPRHTEDAISLRSSGHIISEHNTVSPDICHGLVRDLESPVGKGAALFAKRKKKSSEWIVDEEKVRSHMRAQGPAPEPPGTNFANLSSGVPNQRVKLLKTPWDAALESPIGSCDAAFIEVNRGILADTVIRAAENRRRDSLPTSPIHDVGTCKSPPVPMSPAAAYYEIYKPKAPRGWVGSPFSSESSSRYSLPDQPISTATETSTGPTLRQTSSLPRKMVFQNFNTVPRQWRSSVN